MDMKPTSRLLSFGSLAIVVLVLIAATLVEQQTGSAQAIYGAWWFASVWAITAVSGLCYCLRRRLQRRPATFLLHVALVTILGGALITHIWGRQGMVHLREGEAVSSFLTAEHETVRLPFSLVLDDFEVICDPGTTTHADYRSTLLVVRRAPATDGRTADGASEAPQHDTRRVTISMNHIAVLDGYRFYQSSYDSDLHGSVLAVCHDPWGIGVTYTGYGLLFLTMLLLLLLPHEGLRPALRSVTHGQRRAMAVLVLGAIGLALFVVSRIYAKPLVPVLRSPYLGIHVGIIVVAYTLLAAAVVIALAALLRRRCPDLHRLSRALLFPALFCLAAGIFIGAIWANVSWGRYWGWDPKEVWALITMLVYAFALHGESLPAFRRPCFFHAYLLLAFLTVLMTYFGVNYLLGGLHSY